MRRACRLRSCRDESRASARPHRPGLPERRRSRSASSELWSYGEWFRRAAAIAGGCAALPGLQAGDRVALFMANCPQYLELLYGIWHAGLVAVPINNKLHAREVAFILEIRRRRCCSSLAIWAIARQRRCGAQRPGLRIVSSTTPEYRRLASTATRSPS
jgi:acyl-CoA synthetase (AMP-forming)/AMP-acid ligase II